MHNTHHFRPAVAMIELIFALIIMGIVMMSAPMLISTATQSGYVAIQQEGINEAATQLNIILDYAWDENDTNGSHATVLNVTNGFGELNGTTFTAGTHQKRRAGTPTLSPRLYKSYDGAEFNASSIGLDAGETVATLDDIDDFNNTSVSLQLDGAAGTSDYIDKNVTITRNVRYIDDTPTSPTYQIRRLYFTPNFSTAGAIGGTSNIKHIQVTLTSNSDAEEIGGTNITLHAFSCNIGSYELEEK